MLVEHRQRETDTDADVSPRAAPRAEPSARTDPASRGAHRASSTRRDLREILRFSLPVFLSEMLKKFRGDLQTLLLGVFSTVVNVGIFTVANKLSFVGRISSAAIMDSAEPMIAELHARNDLAQLGRLYQTTTRWIFLLNFPVILAMIIFAEPILAIFGESFTRLNEAVMYAHALGFLMAAPAALITNAHVRVDVVYEHVSTRTKALLDLIGFCVFLAPVMLLLLIYSGPVVELAWRIGEKSPETDGLPFVFLLKTAMPVFAVTMMMAGVAHAGHAALRWRGLDRHEQQTSTTIVGR
ncbi:MAG: oligosaccharide flippase family protein [Hyphomonadaceae bacterium]|nr:oligosaccharide flippase family protein [Hyphomonadaceae bacterium]